LCRRADDVLFDGLDGRLDNSLIDVLGRGLDNGPSIIDHSGSIGMKRALAPWTNWVQIIDFPPRPVLRYRQPGSSERRGDFARDSIGPLTNKGLLDSLPVSNRINAWALTFFAVAFI